MTSCTVKLRSSAEVTTLIGQKEFPRVGLGPNANAPVFWTEARGYP
jgi:hypothetical protein